MTDNLFPDVKPFPEANPRAVIGGNEPPLEDRIVIQFDQALEDAGLIARIDALVAKGADPKDCPDNEMAGKYGDYIKLTGAAIKAVEEQREVLNRPLLTAQRNLKGRADSFAARLKESTDKVKAKLDTFMNAERIRVREEEARQERIRQAAIDAANEQARIEHEEAVKRAADAAAAAAPAGELPLVETPAPPPPPPPVIEFEPVKVAAPVARGDYGARVGSKKVWKFRIPSIRKLPDAVLKHEKVLAAIDQVVGAQVRGGSRKITGVEIWDEDVTSVR